MEEPGRPRVAHLGDDVGGGAVVVRHLDAGPCGIGSHEPVGDDCVEPGREDRFADETVGVRDIRDLEVGDDREAEPGEIPDDGEAGREDEGVADLDRVDEGGAGLRDAHRLFSVEHVQGEDEFGHRSSLSRVAATSIGRLMVASP